MVRSLASTARRYEVPFEGLAIPDPAESESWRGSFADSDPTSFDFLPSFPAFTSNFSPLHHISPIPLFFFLYEQYTTALLNNGFNTVFPF